MLPAGALCTAHRLCWRKCCWHAPHPSSAPISFYPHLLFSPAGQPCTILHRACISSGLVQHPFQPSSCPGPPCDLFPPKCMRPCFSEPATSRCLCTPVQPASLRPSSPLDLYPLDSFPLHCIACRSACAACALRSPSACLSLCFFNNSSHLAWLSYYTAGCTSGEGQMGLQQAPPHPQAHHPQRAAAARSAARCSAADSCQPSLEPFQRVLSPVCAPFAGSGASPACRAGRAAAPPLAEGQARLQGHATVSQAFYGGIGGLRARQFHSTGGKWLDRRGPLLRSWLRGERAPHCATCLPNGSDRGPAAVAGVAARPTRRRRSQHSTCRAHCPWSGMQVSFRLQHACHPWLASAAAASAGRSAAGGGSAPPRSRRGASDRLGG